nr:SpoIIIAH-like family protein [Desulforadius tongensis]
MVLALVGAALVGIGYAGIGKMDSDIPAETTAATVTEVKPENAALEKPQSEGSGKEQKKNDGFFIEYRLERERTRGQQVEWLREIINNPNAEADTRKKAQEKLYAITQNIGKEMEMENLIRAKGFKDAVVLLQDKGATVVVQSESLTTEQAAKIAELVSRNTGIPMNGIVIIPKP